MTITTTCNLGPLIYQSFDPYLLMSFLEISFKDLHERVIPRALKKIRSQDIGKRKQFEILYQKYMETYERKKIEEAEYDKKIKEALQKRPNIPNSGQTCSFRRMEAKKFT